MFLEKSVFDINALNLCKKPMNYLILNTFNYCKNDSLNFQLELICY